MAFEAGSTVKKGDKYGRVVSTSGDKVTWRQSNGLQRTDNKSDVEAADDWMGSAKARQPDAMEVVANVGAFAGTQLIRKRKALGEATMRFAVEDALYEFIFKRWLQENVESKISL